jgi:hypothetical protein
MTRIYFVLGFSLTMALMAVGNAKGADKKENALTFNAEIIKVETDKAGNVQRIFFEATNKDLGIGKSDLQIAKDTKFTFVDEKGTRALSAKEVLTDETAKEHFQTGKTVRITGAAGFAKEIQFGPAATKPKK